jgi:DNA-binding GntR family transcriptional regulator
MGISFLPASEALLRLECDGILEKRARAGTRIRIPTRQNVAGHFVVREALEVQAAMLFAASSTAREKSEVLKLAARVDIRAMRGGSNPLVYPGLHEKLHLLLAECTRCSALVEHMVRMSTLESTWFGAMKAVPPHNPPGHHEALIKALLSADPVEAASVMRSHIRSNAAIVLQSLEPFFQLEREYKANYSRTINKAQKRPSELPMPPSPWAGRRTPAVSATLHAAPDG